MRPVNKVASAVIALTLIAFGTLYSGNPNPSTPRWFVTPVAPVNGTNEVQTITFAGTITGGTFVLRFNNFPTGSINWSSTNSTLLSNIDGSLKALASIGTSGVSTAIDSMTAGIGTINVTFIGRNAKLDVSQMSVSSSLTGAGATVSVSTTTPGVTADGRNSNQGSLCVAQDTGAIYENSGTPPNPQWNRITAYTPTPTPTATATSTPTPTPTPTP